MSNVKAGLRYSAEHEWVTNDSPAVVGISEVAADALGEIVYVDLPEVGAAIEVGAVVGEVESTKSVSEIFSPVAGEVVEVNDAVVADPAQLNADPYGAAWLFKVAVTEEGPLLDADQYASDNDAQVSA
ncbi:glycine cleavage system protein GcvH [Leucobacter chromiiresistens]|uniref:Glycine cleavage system H protein n=1 Tax=Leucobacter chromiiresistens TaxID=1079994 RepID=A0A1H0ZDP5_9MICO|nr:glycine cleavage system protein GcvH [Leucobacter chromiiresistens]SDQ25558.1 glycine cleavage system H protein [Leucobacter chromiiresistens]